MFWIKNKIKSEQRKISHRKIKKGKMKFQLWGHEENVLGEKRSNKDWNVEQFHICGRFP